jgi:site-specific recombinase XerD
MRAANRTSGKRTGRWSFSSGSYGSKVRTYERADRPGLWLRYRDRVTGKPVQAALGHTDRIRAKQECRELAEALASAPPPQPAEPDVVRETDRPPVKWEDLFTRYEAECSVSKKHPAPAEDKRRRKVWSHFLRERDVHQPSDLDEHHLKEFILLRRHGDLRVPEVALPGPAPIPPRGSRETRQAVVTERTIDADLVYLNTLLNWALKRKVDGRMLLAVRPVTIPRLKTRKPRRPVATHDDLRPLCKVADSIDPQRLFGCFLRLLHNLGWRVTGVCYIRGSDVDLTRTRYNPHGRIRKNELVDKENVGEWIPMSRHSRATVRRLMHRTGVQPGEHRFLFAAPRRAEAPWSRFRVRDLMHHAEAAARIAHIGGEHAWRRKWFSERKDYPVADLMRAGGHSDPRSVHLYTQADPETTLEVVSRPTRRVRRDRPR